MSFLLNRIIFFFFCLNLSCLNIYHNIFIPFRTKNLRVDYDNANYEEIEEENKNVNASSFLNKWFYNGIYFTYQIGTPTQHLTTYLNLDNSYFTIGKCDKIKESTGYTLTKDRFISSKSLKIKEIKDKNNNLLYNIGNDNILFYDSSNYHSTVYVNEEYNGLDFLYDSNENDERLCGNVGLSINYNDDKNTNFIEQLKQKKIISKYIWTLDYFSLSDGVITIGTEPHFYESNKNFYSQYKTIYANLNNNKKSWSFIFDKININGTDYYLKDREVELLIDHGLIIGTEEYKTYIEKSYFNQLIKDEICFKQTAKLELEKSLSKDYFIYYCDKLKFKGDYTSKEEKPFNKFDKINFYQKGLEYIFKMGKEVLFEDIDDKVYFLIIFEKNNNNKVWKLGEPFISKYKFVFNQEQKTIGFYNPLLKKIPNSEYSPYNTDQKEKNNNNSTNDNNYKTESILNNLKNIMFIIVSILIIVYIIKKILNKRKIRANELIENYDYLPNKNTQKLYNSFENN